jgi:ubiquinol-cytochrome c reductase cytochrome c subunit
VRPSRVVAIVLAAAAALTMWTLQPSAAQDDSEVDAERDQAEQDQSLQEWPADERFGAETLSDEEMARGRELYLRGGCSSCHGIRGQGTDQAPSLEEAGAAGAYYYLDTGRMPMPDFKQQPRRKTPAFTPEEIRILVGYVDSLGDGPPVPEVDIDGADLAEGGVLFRSNCAPCHSAAGAGGALSYGRAAPGIHEATPEVIAAAMRIGPGEMPVFGPETFSQEEMEAIVAYARYVDDPERPGGAGLGGVGPIPEGFVAWIFGIGSLILAVYWIGTRHHGPAGHSGQREEHP